MDNSEESTAVSVVLGLAELLGPWGVVTVITLGWLMLKSRKARKGTGKVVGKLMGRLTARVVRYFRITLWAARMGIGIRLALRLQKERWRKMTENRQLVGLKRGKVQRTKVGVDIHVAYGGKLTADYVQDKLTAIETGLALRKGSTRLVEGATQNRGVLRISTRGVLPKVLPLDVPQGRVSIKDPHRLAPNEFGEWTTLNLCQRILIVGASGSGKSSAQRVLSLPVILAEDAELEVWDLKKGVESQHYDGLAVHRVIDADGCVERIEQLLSEELEWRAREMKLLGTSTWPTSRTHPVRIIMIDEGAAPVRELTVKQLKQLVTLIEQARAFGVFIWLATQFPTDENLPTELRSQFSAVVALLMERASESRIVFEDGVKDGWAPHRLPGVGWCLLRDAKHRTPDVYKLPFIDEAVFRDIEPGKANPAPREPVAHAPTVEFVPSDAEMSSKDKLVFALRSAGPEGAHYKDLMKFLDLSQPRVYQLRDELIAEKRIEVVGRGRVALVMEGVEA
ncbi:hypothetical protein ACFPA8_07725 [Streptomyces ovatisporus]|uniref:FtsK domain-containing protein n=1 Tax=Streptomyces ovatisporus TaxID=1128682 RepID=A0ABV9A4W2_9ACTN